MVSGEQQVAQLPRRRWKALALLGVSTLVLHFSLLEGAIWAWRPAVVPPNPTVVQVRTVTPNEGLPPVLAAEPLHRPVAKPAAPRAAQAVAPRLETLQAERPPPPAPAPQPPPQPTAPSGPVAEDVAAVAAPVAPATAVAGFVSATTSSVPADRAQVPPDITYGYDLKRGLLRGTGELHWQEREGEYTLRFDATVAGFTFLQQVSTGSVDDTGLSPRRFTDQRAGREVRATNFQREAGKITFSGPSVEFPWVAGTQDRLSLLIQLAAIVSADPRRREPGGQVAMAVVGVRGDLGPWVFRYVGDETVETGVGPVSAAKFVRERPDAYDTRLEVWLDPGRYHLPVRAVQRAGPDDEGWELLLRQAGAQP